MNGIYWTLCKWVALIERSFQRRPAMPTLREKR